MNLNEAKNVALTLMAQHNIIAMGYRFAFNNRKRAAGVCKYRSKLIELSAPITELADEKDVIETIIHEIAHALTPGHGHNHVWRKKYIEIGGNGKRCYDDTTSLGIAYQMIAKYKGVCPNGHEMARNRMPKNRQSCGKCCSRFDERYLITWTRNY